MSLRWKALPVFALLVLVLVPSAVGRRGTKCPAAGTVLPDLLQEVPSDLRVDSVRSGSRVRFRLRFTTATSNLGPGPLEIAARRVAGEPEMRAAQIVRLRGGGTCAYSDAGTLRFDTRQSHDHWHLLGFDSYLLTSGTGARPLRRGHKAGYCLRDSAPLESSVPGARARPAWTSDCALGHPAARSLTEGISIGWADLYPAVIPGQVLDITELPAGDYVLMNRVNPSRTLHETSYRNDAAAVRINLRWQQGPHQLPRVRVLAVCPRQVRC